MAASLAALSCSAPVPPAWPEPADVDVETELRATAEELNLPLPPSVDESDSQETAPETPLVQAREGTAAGLQYIEVVLGDVDMETPLPMVLMLHGRGDQPKIPGGPFACVNVPMRIIMPRAPSPFGPGYTWLSLRVAQGRTEEISAEIAARSDQLAELLVSVLSERPTLGRPIVTGFSQGGLLTFALAIRHPLLVTSAFPLAGWLPPPLWPATGEGIPFIRSVHGTDDATIPLAPTREAVTFLKGIGVDIELLEFEGAGHIMNPAMNLQFEQWLELALQREAPALASRPADTSVELDQADPGMPLCE